MPILTLCCSVHLTLKNFNLNANLKTLSSTPLPGAVWMRDSQEYICIHDKWTSLWRGLTQWIRSRRTSEKNIDLYNQIESHTMVSIQLPCFDLEPWRIGLLMLLTSCTCVCACVFLCACEANLCWRSITWCSAGWPVAALWRLFVLCPCGIEDVVI